MADPGSLDADLQQPARLRLMAMLITVSALEFSIVRDRLAVSDSVLSKHVAALTDVGYVASRKGVHDGRRTTWLRCTPRGRRAFAAHAASLQAIIAGVGRSGVSAESG